ncbi:DUF1028 domain-containing protein [Haloferax sp. YSMS24]|uniref:DUF1028 domain-containing protein n=1 Tax=Haloferax sp. YSMS24 TaxID=3388425 RepID=UPI00398CFC3E
MRHAPGTFSIAARDPDTSTFGAAVTTGTVAVGATCPYVSATAAVVTQSYTNTNHGRDAVARTDEGERLDDVLDERFSADENADYRQVHGVGRDSEFTFTGDECVAWAGHRVGDDYTVGGNMLAGSDVVDATAEAYESTDGDMAERLVSALEAGESAGGDDRGEMSAAILVHAPDPEFYHNLRVDLSADPVSDLRALLTEARQAKGQIRSETDELFADYPDEILNFGVKY